MRGSRSRERALGEAAHETREVGEAIRGFVVDNKRRQIVLYVVYRNQCFKGAEI